MLALITDLEDWVKGIHFIWNEDKKAQNHIWFWSITTPENFMEISLIRCYLFVLVNCHNF